MTVRPIRYLGDPVLRRPAKKVSRVDDSIRRLIADMTESMYAAQGVGIAAPQIGVGLQVVIFGLDHNPRYPDAEPVPHTVLVNPLLTPLGDDMEEGWEGCLSVPGMRGVVPRYVRLRYQGRDEHGNPIDRVASGFHARVVQHEYDHLIGVLYPMRIRDFTRFGYTDVLFPEGDVADE